MRFFLISGFVLTLIRLYSAEVVLITGSSSGIGLEATRYLAEKDYIVYATCRDLSNADSLGLVAKTFKNVSILFLDVTSQDSIDAAVNKIVEKEGKIDVLVNNAGFGIYGPAETHTPEEIEQIFDTNVFGVLRMSKAVIPVMRKQLKGKIINISSVSGLVPSKNLPVYSASKAALEYLTAADAYHLDRWNIKLVLIQPGAILSEFEKKTQLGSYFKDKENPYESLIKNRKTWKQLMEQGNSCTEVAETIYQAILDPNPDLWWQTSSIVKQKASEHFKDPTGNIRIPKN